MVWICSRTSLTLDLKKKHLRKIQPVKLYVTSSKGFLFTFSLSSALLPYPFPFFYYPPFPFSKSFTLSPLSPAHTSHLQGLTTAILNLPVSSRPQSRSLSPSQKPQGLQCRVDHSLSTPNTKPFPNKSRHLWFSKAPPAIACTFAACVVLGEVIAT
jgi:hypothetical protein